MKTQRIHGNWREVHEAMSPCVKAKLFRDLCDIFHSGERAMLCALSHGQVSIDGYIIRPHHLHRWDEDQLRGRYVRLLGRTAQLYGEAPGSRCTTGPSR